MASIHLLLKNCFVFPVIPFFYLSSLFAYRYTVSHLFVLMGTLLLVASTSFSHTHSPLSILASIITSIPFRPESIDSFHLRSDIFFLFNLPAPFPCFFIIYRWIYILSIKKLFNVYKRSASGTSFRNRISFSIIKLTISWRSFSDKYLVNSRIPSRQSSWFALLISQKGEYVFF